MSEYITRNIVLDEETNQAVQQIIEKHKLSPQRGASQAVRIIIREWLELRGLLQMEMAVAQNFRGENA